MNRRRLISLLGSSGAALGLLAWAPARSQEADAEPGPYDLEYPAIGYSGPARANAIVRLQDRLARGEAQLVFEDGRGYLDSVLAALDIDPSSQTLVFSRSSLQTGSIRASTPRAIYFNDDAYVAWVQGGDLLELAAMDAELGPVFYTLDNRTASEATFERELNRCLRCHDSFSQTGGGVPRFMLVSSYVDIRGVQLTHEGRILTTDETPIRFRWGGWYVTGRHGEQVHLGNILVRDVNELTDLEAIRRGNLDTLEGLFDATPYLTDKSDIVALLVLQHQTYVQNLITRVSFEVRTALAAQRPDDLSPEAAERLRAYMDELVDAMLFVNAAPITDTITGGSGFDAWFEAQGPRDSQGRSLRELDLETRLFRHPLSYLVYSGAFDALPGYARSYVYDRFRRILSGADSSERYDRLSAADRAAVMEILTDTKPAFAAGAQAAP